MLVTNSALGDPLKLKQSLITTAAVVTQDLSPVKTIHAHLNAFHAYADNPHRAVETNHYCGHLNNDVRQCLLYDSSEADARLIGVEYMITPALFQTLSPEEQKLWHSHVYEVKSGMLVMPNSVIPDAMWARAEYKEMEKVVELYGKAYHLWQTDADHKLPLGKPKLMTSFTADGQLSTDKLESRDKKFNVDHKEKRAQRKDMPEPQVHPKRRVAIQAQVQRRSHVEAPPSRPRPPLPDVAVGLQERQHVHRRLLALPARPGPELGQHAPRARRAEDPGDLPELLAAAAPRLAHAVRAAQPVKILVEVEDQVVGGVVDEAGADAGRGEGLPVDETRELGVGYENDVVARDAPDSEDAVLVRVSPFEDVNVVGWSREC
ncbi:DUF1264 domain protein [Cordyceps fumosorosea ARSEF 2679]|uniref:DUF1264 domain protein n=1 Tax=Cordyceps fumosorosea (strain ARSEF 2679) TaxID=1081104 RepID=A0A167LE07_CORFA|nr:DUF1264 domain protein [Cordyceps fumosorosea ARSEF 2679]OAA52976.1 DUF1264 domain protein [Cordyceps fumosorosea ARSEF 2679]